MQIGRVFCSDLGIASDAKYALEAVIEEVRAVALDGKFRRFNDWVAKVVDPRRASAHKAARLTTCRVRPLAIRHRSLHKGSRASHTIDSTQGGFQITLTVEWRVLNKSLIYSNRSIRGGYPRHRQVPATRALLHIAASGMLWA